ncbi:MAG: hypothetical protein ACD_73C00626G0004, partial [uncultured bacterium]
GWNGMPQLYATPATEESLLNLFSVFLQNMAVPKQESISCIDFYQSSYSVPDTLPTLLEEYLYTLSTCITLNNDVVGLHPNFSYEYFLHFQLENFLKNMKLEKGAVLEMGCGAGKNLLFIKKNFPLMNVCGIEPTSTGINSGVKAATHWGLDINFHLMPGEQCQLPDNSFDLVYCHCVLMYSNIKYNEIFQNMYRMSKRWILLIDMFPELWEQGTQRTMASLNYFQLKKYNFNFYNSLLRNDLKLNYRILFAQRCKHAWNPLSEPSLVIIEKLGNTT